MLDFPNAPAVNDVFTSGSQSWKWDGVKWVAITGSTAVPGLPSAPTGRLTLTSGVPFPVVDQLAQTSIYWTLLNGNTYPWWNGTLWTVRSLVGELTLALNTAAHLANKNYDLFLFNDAGTDRLVAGPAWTSDTVRASAISLLNGFYVNTASLTASYGAATVTVPASRGLYVGTFRTSGNGQTQMKFGGTGALGVEAFFYLWNRFNQKPAISFIQDNSGTGHTYTGVPYRLWGGASSHFKTSFVRGLAEDTVIATLASYCALAIANATMFIGIGLDSATSTSGLGGEMAANALIGTTLVASYEGYVPIGFHYLAGLERSDGLNASTFFGDAVDGGGFSVRCLG